MAKERIQVPLSFELGWQRQGAEGRAAVPTERPSTAQEAVR
jgi:hypothetical protein